MKKSAVISDCGHYRYVLRRVWDESKTLILFIALNPSTADGEKDDNTSRVCINYAKRWGYGGLLLGNLFAYRSTEREKLYGAADPVGPDNDGWLKELRDEAGAVVCAWGRAGGYRHRDRAVLSFLHQPYCLTKLKSGYPGHPLYKSKELEPIPYDI